MLKICCHCGKDVSGHTRFKDSRGYWCKECHKQDQAARDEDKCDSCGRTFPSKRLIDIDGHKYCATCDKERQKKMMDNLRRQAKRASYWKTELKGIQTLMIVAVALIAIILLAWFKVL